MTDNPQDALPDASRVREAALAAVGSAPAGWLRLTYILWFKSAEFAQGKFWVEGADGRHVAKQPPAGVPLLTLRQDMIERGQPPWLRADLTVERPSMDGPITYNVDFAYEAGDIPQ